MLSPVDERKIRRAEAFDLMLRGRLKEGQKILDEVRQEVGGAGGAEPPTISERELTIKKRRSAVRKIRLKNKDLTYNQIAKKMGISRATVGNDISALKKEGKL